MNKKKIISSLTIAGMIASAGMSNVFAAEEDTATTPALGEFTKLIEGSNVTAIPFKLQSESDRVTGKDLMIAYPGKIISVEPNQVIKTGDVVRIGGQPRTIVIYGDVNKDGAVDIFDVTKVVDNVVNENHKLTGVELAAADLNRDGVADILDITRVVSTIAGESYASMNVTLPKEEVAKVSNLEIPSATRIDVKFDYNNASDYTFTVTDDKTGKNITVTKAEYDSKEKITKLTLEKEMIDIAKDRNQTYSLTVKDKSGKVVSENKNFKYTKLNEIESATVDTDDAVKTIINTNNVNNLAVKVKLKADTVDSTDKSNLVPATVSVTLIDSAKREVVGTVALPASANEVIVNNFSGVDKLEDGIIKVKVEIIDESGNIVSYESQDGNNTQGNTSNSTHFVKDTKELKIGNVEATRSGNEITSLKVDMIGNNTLANVTVGNTTLTAKAYVMVLPTNSTSPTKDAVIDDDNERTIATDGVITLEKEKNLTDNNASTTGYTVYVVVENANGVLSDVAKTDLPVAIPSTTLKKVTKIKAIETQPGWFEWKDDENDDTSEISGYLVKLYADDRNSMQNAPVLVATQTITNPSTKSINFLQTIKEYIQEHNSDDDAEKNYQYFSIEVISLAKGTNVKSSDSTKLAQIGNNYVDGEYVYTSERLATPDILSTTLTFNDNKHLILGYVPADLGDFAGFDVNIYKVDEDGVVASSPCATGTATREKKECDLTAALSGQEEGKYQVKIVAISSGSTKADSLESEGRNIYFVNAPSVTLKALSSSSFEVKFYSIDDIQVKNDTGFSYKLTVEKVAASGTKTQISSNMYTSAANVYDKDNSLYTVVVNNVDPETKYNVFVTVEYDNQNIAKSDVKQITMEKAPITTNGNDVTVVASKNDAGNGIYYDKDDQKLYMNDATTPVSDTKSNYAEVVELVKKLKSNDKITIGNDGKISKVTITNIEEVDLGTILKDGTLSVEAANTSATNRPIVNGTFDKVNVKSNVEFIGTVQDNVTVSVDNLNVKVPAKSIVTLEGVSTATINDITLSNISDSKIKVTSIDKGISIGDLSKTGGNLRVTTTKEATVEFTGNQGKTVELFNQSEDDEVLTVKSENPVDLLIRENSKTVDIENVKYKECKINTNAEVSFSTKKTLKFGEVDYTIDPTEKVTVKHIKANNTNRDIIITGKATITFTESDDVSAKPTLDNEGKLDKNNIIAAGEYKDLGTTENNLRVTATQASATYYVTSDHEVTLNTSAVGGVITIHRNK